MKKRLKEGCDSFDFRDISGMWRIRYSIIDTVGRLLYIVRPARQAVGDQSIISFADLNLDRLLAKV